jgi:2-polyprenyl-3-methyl-5-hydroxy-6-metoxy-1,4-benzoquinol methylase
MAANKNQYQYGFSTIHFNSMHNHTARVRKARTMVLVLREYLRSDLKTLNLLDIGCSTGIISDYLSHHFGSVTGIDIDRPAVTYASATFKKDNLTFSHSDSLHISQPDDLFDVAICAQVYEHVPDANQMMDEIYRVLKPGGVCYFAAGNRIQLIEPHYNLPFLSILPLSAANAYLRLTGKGKVYYEKHLSFWGLKRLVRKFACIDYTRKIIEDPRRFHAGYLLPPGSLKNWFAKMFVRHAYQIVPGYIWLLKKIIP